MRPIVRKIKEVVSENNLIAEPYEIDERDLSITKEGIFIYQVVPESEAATMLDEGRGIDGYPALNFEFRNRWYYFILQ